MKRVGVGGRQSQKSGSEPDSLLKMSQREKFTGNQEEDAAIQSPEIHLLTERKRVLPRQGVFIGFHKSSKCQDSNRKRT